ncbi:MAG: GNAT family N-acetyltransferase [Acidimicrobiia bacterium]|nr:GNAT family N-acetyltransferase [Acidimicrobiia bacterium]MDH3462106.1 GNAT family N-acetyltransferase [Acidimicrobiia bacterium]
MEVRAVQLEDAEAIHALTRRWEQFWNAPLVTPVDEIKEEMQLPHLNMASDTRSYWLDEKMIAFGRIWHRPGGRSLERAYVQGLVDPQHRKIGIGRDLLSWQIARATEILNDIDNDLPKYVRANEWDWIEECHSLYRRFGLEPVRYFTEMLLALDGRATVTDVPGVEIIAYDRALDQQALEVINTSFADHWGSTPVDSDSYRHRVEGYGMRLDASFLAMSGDEVIGVCLNTHYPEDEELLGRRDGWVETLGVLRDWRKQGVATALLQTSFNAFLDLGFTHSSIGVDTANPSDAHRLYASLGYEPMHRSITSQLQV